MSASMLAFIIGILLGGGFGFIVSEALRGRAS